MNRLNLEKEQVDIFKDLPKLTSDDYLIINENREKDIVIKNQIGEELYGYLINNSYIDSNGYNKILNYIKYGANLDFRETNRGNFPLLICARKNFINAFSLLVQAGADLNLKTYFGTTATMAAARHNSSKILEILIKLGADVNARCKDGDSALSSAIIHDSRECVDLLLKANAFVNILNISNYDLMHSSINKSDIQISSLSTPVKEDKKTLDDTIILAIEQGEEIVKGYKRELGKVRKRI